VVRPQTLPLPIKKEVCKHGIMIFNSLTFLVFAPLAIIGYYLLRGRSRLAFMLLASYVFYGWWDWRFLSLILLSTVVDYYVGLKLETASKPRRRKQLLLVSCILNLGLLGVFKYFNFFLESLVAGLKTAGLDWNYQTLQVILPVGISFYTFQTLSYTIDRYRGTLKVERNFLRFSLYVAFFPQLVAGPIVRAADLLPQLQYDQKFRWEGFCRGVALVIWGYFLKVGIADSLAPVVDIQFANPEFYSAISLQIGALFYAIQIYGDFAGYSCIAIGIAWMMGFDFGANFNRPYFSASFSEFWTRWHISLSSWLRDYLYIPLGGNRYGKLNMYRNLMLTMLLGGLWHGASWNFVIWGGLHGMYLIVQRFISPLWAALTRSWPKRLTNAILIPVIFFLTCLGWIFFRSQGIGDAWNYLERMLSFNSMSFSTVTSRFLVVKGLGLISMLLVLEWLSFRIDFMGWFLRRPLIGALAGAALLATIAFLGTFSSNAFIYFQF
jgi:alginate O-acetyltransferase complex protein AlgI